MTEKFSKSVVSFMAARKKRERERERERETKRDLERDIELGLCPQ
jgi:hypothetical protein